MLGDWVFGIGGLGECDWWTWRWKLCERRREEDMVDKGVWQQVEGK